MQRILRTLLLLFLTMSLIVSCSAVRNLTTPTDENAGKIQAAIQSSNGCEWSVKQAPPSLVVKALRQAQDAAPTPADKQAVRAYRERVARQDLAYTKNCETVK